jgi:hypothetical protein
VNRRLIETKFAALPLRQPTNAPAGDPPSRQGAKSKAKSGARSGRVSCLEIAAKSNKQQASCDVNKPSKRGKHTLENITQHVNQEITPSQSEARSFRPQPSQTTRSFADGSEWSIQSAVVS